MKYRESPFEDGLEVRYWRKSPAQVIKNFLTEDNSSDEGSDQTHRNGTRKPAGHDDYRTKIKRAREPRELN